MKNADVPHIKGVCQVCTHIQVTERIPMTQHIFLQQETKSTFFRTEVLHFVHFIGPTFCRLCPSQKLYHRSKSLKNSWFFSGSMSDPPVWRLWHHMQNCITCWYYITVTLYHISIYIYLYLQFIQMYIYTHVLYVCNDDVIWSQRLISVQVSTPVSWDAISAGSHRLQRVRAKQ